MDTNSVNQDDLEAFFKHYGEALATGNLTALAACYAVPALFLGNEDSIPIATRSEIEAAFKDAAEQYRAQGLVAAHPTVLRAEAITEQLVWAEVNWHYLDERGNTAHQDVYRYVLRLDAYVGAQIQVVMAIPEASAS